MTPGMFTSRPHGTYISRNAFRTAYTLRSGAFCRDLKMNTGQKQRRRLTKSHTTNYLLTFISPSAPVFFAQAKTSAKYFPVQTSLSVFKPLLQSMFRIVTKCNKT